MVDALYGVGLDRGFLVAGKIDVWEDQQGFCVPLATLKVQVKLMDWTPRSLQPVWSRASVRAIVFVIDLVGKMRRQESDRQGNGRFDLHAEFLAVVVGSHQTVDLGYRRDLIFFVEDAAPVELRLNAIVVLDVEIVGGDELSHSGSENDANRGEGGLLGPALVAEGDNHWTFGGKMTLVNRAGDVFLHAKEAEIRRGSGLHGGVPFVGPSHGHGDGISGVDLHMHAAAPDSGMVDAAGVEASGLQRDRFAVGSAPVDLRG